MEFTATANGNSTIGHVEYDSKSWSVGSGNGASQGIYDTSRNFLENDRRVGLMVFDGAGAALQGAHITQISLRFVNEGAGYRDENKTLYVRKANFQTLDKTKTGGEYVGDLLGTLTGKFYSNTTTYILNKTNNAELFEALRNYFKTGNSAIVIFDESTAHASAGADYTYNYLRIATCVLTVTYENGSIVYYDNGNEIVPCRVYYDNGSEIVLCDVYRDNGSEIVRM